MRKSKAQREAECSARMANRRSRILKSRVIKEFIARIERDAYNYLEQLCVVALPCQKWGAYLGVRAFCSTPLLNGSRRPYGDPSASQPGAGPGTIWLPFLHCPLFAA